MALSRGKQCALAALVLLAVASAVWFRRTSAQPLLPHAEAEGQLHVGLTRRLPPGHGERGQVLQSFEESLPRLPTTATADPDSVGREFAPHPDRAFHPGSGLFQRSATLEPLDGQEAQAVADASEEMAEASGLRRHLVVDGDTLARLAARYLGSSDRYGEIFAANRGVLSTPHLLPIGVELVIPPRHKPAPPAALTEQDQDRPATTPADEAAMPRLGIETPNDEPPASSKAGDARASQSDAGQPGSAPSDSSAEEEEALVPIPKPAPGDGS